MSSLGGWKNIFEVEVLIPSVSIIIPNYNKGMLVRHSMESLLCQTFIEWEAIVVDDCSGDESWGLILDYANKDGRIKAFRNETNQGGNYSRNLGARKANGKYFIFLDSDDWLTSDCIENRVSEFEKTENEDVDLLVFNMATTKDGKIGGCWNSGDRENALLSFLRHEMPWSIMMPIWRKSAFERIGRFDETFPRLQDVELHTRALLNGVRYRFASRESPDCFYYIDESRMTANYDASMSRTVSAMLMYVSKMKRLIRSCAECAALEETMMAAVRTIGDCYQAGRIGNVTRDALENKILTSDHVGAWIKFYAWCYAKGVNKIHGFNKLYRLAYRVFA